MAYKRELIINNGSLTSYKKLLKVSDVCQLLDKSKYPATTTTNGVTFTNNGDGTITANGTVVSGHSYAAYSISIPQFREVKNNHKYALFSGINNIINIGYIECIFFIGSGDSYFVTDCVETNYAGTFGFTIPQGEYSSYQKIEVRVRFGYTANNLVFKPQLFDLTEMYGAGNEPATVDEFKAKFPNDLYDYSPRCWVTSYKTGLIAKTKNLFNVNALTPYTPETLPPHTAGRYNGHIITKCGEGTSVSDGYKLLKELCPDLVAGERYILHFDTNGTGDQANIIYLVATESIWVNGYTHVVTEAELNGTVLFYGNYPSLDVATISNFQIEKGTTATDYVPYGYL